MQQRTHILIRYLFVVLFGVFLHFVYKLSGNNPIVGLLAPVNESIWEHLKLLFFPMLVLTFWDAFTNNKNHFDFLPSRAVGILSGMIFIVFFYYTVTGTIGRDIAWINIVIFLLSVAYAFWLERRIYARSRNLSVTWAIIFLIIFIILFIVFTIAPPALGIFILMAA